MSEAESKVKVLEIRVSSGFTLPDNKVINSEDYDVAHNEDVLLNGIALVSRRKELEHRLTVDSITADILRDKDKHIQSLEEEISTLRRRISDTFSSVYEDGRKAAKTELLAEQERMEKELKEIRDGVNYVARIYHRSGGCAKEVGNRGERYVEVHLRNMLSSARVEVRSSKTAEADIRLYYNSYTFLVETKNKSFLDKNDITKFYRDIETNAGEIDAAMLVSLQDTNLVHGYSRTHFEVVHGVPVVYLGNVMETPRAMEIAVRMLTQLLDSGTSSPDSQVEDTHFRTIALKCAQMLMTTFYNEQANIQKDKKIHQRLGQQIAAREKTLLDFRSYQEELRSIFPNVDNLATASVSTTCEVTVGPGDGKRDADLKENIIKWLKDPNNRDSTMADIVKEFNLNGKWQISELGGIKHLKGMASISKGLHKSSSASVSTDEVDVSSNAPSTLGDEEYILSDVNEDVGTEIYQRSSKIDLELEGRSLQQMYGIDAEFLDR